MFLPARAYEIVKAGHEYASKPSFYRIGVKRHVDYDEEYPPPATYIQTHRMPWDLSDAEVASDYIALANHLQRETWSSDAAGNMMREAELRRTAIAGLRAGDPSAYYAYRNYGRAHLGHAKGLGDLIVGGYAAAPAAGKIIGEGIAEVVAAKSPQSRNAVGCANPYDECFQQNRYFVASPKHTAQDRIVNGAKVARGPTSGQDALDLSFGLTDNPKGRRIGVDPGNNEIVVFDRTQNVVRNKEVVGGEYHGHVRDWGELTPAMRKVLTESGITVGRNGRIEINPNRLSVEPKKE